MKRWIAPRSDPWSGLFSDQLDFKFVLGKGNREYVLNTHPRPKEQTSYVPTAPGGATGQSYAIIAFLQNPYSNGRILLLAGANGEGTEAAGDLVTSVPRLSHALEQCGFPHARASTDFEMLLRLNTMAGLPSDVAPHFFGESRAIQIPKHRSGRQYSRVAILFRLRPGH